MSNLPTENAEDTAEASHARRYSAPALEKGLDILELLSSTEEALSLKQIAKQLNRSVNEIFRMLVTLQEREYLVAEHGDRYKLSLKLFELAHRQQPLRSLVSIALPHMRELANRTKQSCHLTAYESGRLVVVAQVDSPERWAFGLKVGTLVGLTDTPSGRIFLAYRDEAERSRMLNAHVKIEGELDVDPAELMRQIQETQAQGYALTPSRQIRGVTNIAYPILGTNQQVLAALNVPYIERIDKQINPSIDEVRETAEEIANRLCQLMGFSDFSDVSGG